jgi:hypothetical protein
MPLLALFSFLCDFLYRFALWSYGLLVISEFGRCYDTGCGISLLVPN